MRAIATQPPNHPHQEASISLVDFQQDMRRGYIWDAPGKHSAGNQLAKLALETTVLMLMCLPLAYGLAHFRIEWFYPAVLMIIGGRYLTFATIYGTRLYWLLGALLGVGGYLGFALGFPPHVTALLGASIELAFGSILLVAKRGRN